MVELAVKGSTVEKGAESIEQVILRTPWMAKALLNSGQRHGHPGEQAVRDFLLEASRAAQGTVFQNEKVRTR